MDLSDFTPAQRTTMTDDRLPLAELLQKAGGGDFLRTVAESALQLL
jgi:putative transposase